MNKFKIILCLTYCILSVTCHEENRFEKCVKETGATPEEVETVMSRDIPETENEKCLTKCVMTELGMITADNRIDLKGVAELLEGLKEKDEDNYNDAYKVFEDCDNEIKDNPNLQNNCDGAKLIVECIVPKFQHEK